MKRLLAILCLISLGVSAKEVYIADNGDTISATISNKNLTRIEIEGQKIIKDYYSAAVTKKITKPLGQVYLVPNQEASFNLYIVSDNGNTYNLHLTPSKKAVGDSILIKPAPSKTKSSVSSLSFSNQTYVRNINYLMQLMYLNTDADGNYNVTPENQAFATYDGLDSVLYKSYTNDVLIGQVLLVKNVSKDKLLLTEGQFFSDHTLAIAIENPELKVNDFTRIFIIKEASL